MPYAEALTTAAAADAACWSGGTTAHLLFRSVALKSSRCSALSRGTECVNNRSNNSTCFGEVSYKDERRIYCTEVVTTARPGARPAGAKSTAVTPLSYA